MKSLLLSTFDALDEAGVVCCLLRDGDRIDRLAELEEVDLLIQTDQLEVLKNILCRHGFTDLLSWGHIPHHFFIAYEESSDSWHKLDVVTEVAFGFPSHAIRTTLAGGCLTRRRRRGPVFIPSAEDELVILLLHCVLDKRLFDSRKRRRLQELCNEVTDANYITWLLAANWSPVTSWNQIRSYIQGNEWNALLAEGKSVSDYLATRDRYGTAMRRIRDKVLRRLNRWARGLHPRAPLVALLAPDGAGKSTVVKGVQSTFYFPVRSIYMGLYKKDGGPAKRSQIPGFGFLRRMLLQWGRYIAARYYQLQGQLVVFDRYSYDALIPPHKPLGWPRRMRRWFLGHSCPPPDMVIVLDAPGEILYSRKGEHNVAFLEEQRQGYLKFRQCLPRVVVIDATKGADSVRREVTGLIWRGYTKQNGAVQ